ncbi:unnamed protein product, partial [Meganyctiphanes norvegica]
DFEVPNIDSDDPRMDITGIFHKIRLPDFVADSSNPHEKLEAVKQHLLEEHKTGGDNGNNNHYNNNSPWNTNGKKLDKINYENRNQNNNLNSYSKEETGSNYEVNKLINVQKDKPYKSYSRGETGTSSHVKNNVNVPAYTKDSSHIREDKGNSYGGNRIAHEDPAGDTNNYNNKAKHEKEKALEEDGTKEDESESFSEEDTYDDDTEEMTDEEDGSYGNDMGSSIVPKLIHETRNIKFE